MKKVLLYLIGLTILIQFIPYGKDHVNPSIISEVKWDSPKTKSLFMKACADCHSYETKWPWYSNVAPVSWFIYHDVEEGREHFNVSAWGHQEENEGNEAAETIEEGEMPMKAYLLAHPEARLSAEEKKSLILGLKNTFGEKKEHDD
jgi:mono/diheme cytochrome c family protein